MELTTGLFAVEDTAEFESPAGKGRCGPVDIVGVNLLDRAAIAALRTCTSGGLIPQVRHGGMGVCAFAVPGSKLDGTGFEKEQMGQIQVALVF